jgi:hypothetical protein
MLAENVALPAEGLREFITKYTDVLYQGIGNPFHRLVFSTTPCNLVVDCEITEEIAKLLDEIAVLIIAKHLSYRDISCFSPT